VQRNAEHAGLCMSDTLCLLYVYCSSFNDAVNKPGYIASSAGMIVGCEQVKVYLAVESKEGHERSQYSRCSGRDFNQSLP
jgi:hypothetical protein